MNALNLLSSKVIGQTSAASRPRSESPAEALSPKQSEDLLRGRSYNDENFAKAEKEYIQSKSAQDKADEDACEATETLPGVDEKSYLLDESTKRHASSYQSRLKQLAKRLADALTAIFATIGTPIVYIVRCFQDEEGRYSPTIPIQRIRRSLRGFKPSQSTASAVGLANAPEAVNWDGEKPARSISPAEQLQRSYSSDSLATTTSDSEQDASKGEQASKRKRPTNLSDEPVRRQSIRIKMNNEESLKKRRSKRTGLTESGTTPMSVDTIKSPTSPASTLKATKYPHAPRPPRPLIARRQPSYSEFLSKTRSLHPAPSQQEQKTLVLDLDETLIHSLAKGGRMSSGYMVEVKLNQPVALAPAHTGQPPPILGPQHPILYYVHKRPHCHEFLRKVSKWYKLVVFTASVQEYADPVIDLLETERKYFSGRYYRQHCTFRNGAYIKDLSSIEPDLSKVMILDNSPVSYIFHEDNAIPIEGWINDPTDNNLLHLIPLLEALQYVPDVRALLALRRGEAETS